MRGDVAILELLRTGRLLVDPDRGLAFAPRSNTPDKPIGALTSKGYLRACVTFEGRQMHFMVHRIVWASVNGPVPEGWQVDHRDTDKRNNRISNLEAVPARVNMARAKDAGLYQGVGRRDGVRDSKGRFGRLLDGRERNEMPGARG